MGHVQYAMTYQSPSQYVQPYIPQAVSMQAGPSHQYQATVINQGQTTQAEPIESGQELIAHLDQMDQAAASTADPVIEYPQPPANPRDPLGLEKDQEADDGFTTVKSKRVAKKKSDATQK